MKHLGLVGSFSFTPSKLTFKIPARGVDYLFRIKKRELLGILAVRISSVGDNTHPQVGNFMFKPNKLGAARVPKKEDKIRQKLT